MKRLFFIILIAACVTTNHVYAATGGVYNDPIKLGPNITKNDTAPDPSANAFLDAQNMDPNAPFENPDLTLPSTMFIKAAPYLLPFSILGKTIPEEDNLELSGRTALYIHTKIPGLETITITIPQNLYTVAIPKWHKVDQGTQQLQFLQYNKSLRPDESGNYTFTRTPKILEEVPSETGTDKGSNQKTQETKILKPSLLTWAGEITDKLSKLGQIKITLASKQLLPYAGEVWDNTKGLALNYAPISHDITKGEPLHGEQKNDIALGKTTTTRTENTKGIENASSYILCSLLPPAQQTKFELDCKNYATEKTSCGTKLPDLSITDASCSLCSSKDIANISSTFFPDGKIPETMIKILEKAGESYHVPPKMLLLTLFAEGGHPNYLQGEQWTEENVQKWSICGEPMPFCDPNTATAMLPFGIRPEVFEQYKTAVSTIFPERKGVENPCNFMDQAFAAAKILSDNMNTKLPSSTFGTRIIPDGTCLGVPISKLTATRQPTSCNWNELDLYRGRLMYLRYCPQTGKTGGYAANDQTLNWSKMFSSSFQCQ